MQFKDAALNGHAVGIVMKEIVRRAIETLRQERFIFEAKVKQGYGGDMDDLVTTADAKAQEIYVKLIRECFPTFGIVAEEDDLIIPCTNKFHEIYFTIDPLDGTKAYSRRQSDGIGTMLSLICEGVIIAVYIGDVMTWEVYGYRPGSDDVNRISDYSLGEKLVVNTSKPLTDRYLLLREGESKHSELIQKMLGLHGADSLFKDSATTSGSIGISMAKIWKSEYAAAIMRPSHNTPWDMSPVVGISEKLGFSFFRIEDTGKAREFQFIPEKEISYFDHELLIIHGNYRNSVLEWVKKNQ